MSFEDLAEVICDAIKDREKLYVLDLVVNRLKRGPRIACRDGGLY